MATKLKTGFGAIGFFRVEISIDGSYSAEQEEKIEHERWIEENCEGRFFIGGRSYSTRTSHRRAFLFESEFDLMAFKLAWT